MNKFSVAILGAGLLALAACGGQGDDAAGDNAASAAEAQAEKLEAMADNTTNEAAADSLQNQVEAVEEAGEAKEEAMDAVDVNATNYQKLSLAVRISAVAIQRLGSHRSVLL